MKLFSGCLMIVCRLELDVLRIQFRRSLMILRVPAFLLPLVAIFQVCIRCLAARVFSCPDLRSFLSIEILFNFASLDFEVSVTLPLPLVFGSWCWLLLHEIIELVIVLSVASLALLSLEAIHFIRFWLCLDLLLVHEVVMRIASLLVIWTIFLHSLIAVQVEGMEVL